MGCALLAGAGNPAQAQVRVDGRPDAVHIEARDVPLQEVLAALQSKFNLRYRTDDALETRKLVERAKGILMRRMNLTEEEAFRRMQRRSQNENKKLGEIAEAIITADGML